MDQKAIIAIVIAAVVVVGGGVGIAIALSNGGDSEASYTVKFNVNGGNAIDDKSFTKNTETFSLPDAARDGGYTFLGWYGNADFTGDKITQVEKGTEKDIEVWAKWQLVLANNTAPTAAQVTANTDVKVTFDSGLNKEDEKRTITPEVRDALTSGKTLTIEDTQQNLTWTFTGSDSKQTGYADETFDTAVVATPDTENKKVVLAFDYEGTLPYQSTVRYLFGVNYAGQQVTAENSRTHEIIGPCTVDAQGYVEFPIDHCSDWVLAVSYNVTFDAAGGTIDGAATKTVTVQYKDAVGALPTAKRTGYTFAAWTPAVTAETAVTDNVTYTATWTENQYTINFDKNSNDATGTMGSITIGYTETKNIPACTFTNTGYSASWNTLANGSGTAIAAGGSITGQLASEAAGVESLVVTLFAQWTANTYTVAFDGNGSTSGNVASVNASYGVVIIIQPNGFTKTGNAFAGWNTAADGSGTPYQSGAEVSNLTTENGATVTMYAQWNPVTYKLHFNKASDLASGTMADQTVTYGVLPAINECDFTSESQAFGGWATTEGGAVVFADGASLTTDLADTQDAVVNLYAVWEDFYIQMNILFDGQPDPEVYENVRAIRNEVSYPMARIGTGVYKVSSTAQAPIVNDGYDIYIGEMQVAGIVVSGGKAIVDLDYFTVSFDTGCDIQIPSQKVIVNGYVQEPQNINRAGYDLTGWKKGNVDWNFYTQVTEITTLTAQWAPKTYTVTLNTNNGTINSGNVTQYTYNVAANLPTDVTRDGYDFAGWYANSQFTGDSVSAIAAGEYGNKEYFAKWDLVTYTVTFEAQGGTPVDSLTYNVESQTFALPTNTSKTGYHLSGWYVSDPASSITQIAQGTHENMALKANWVANTYTVTFLKNSEAATGTMETQNMTYGTSATLMNIGFTNAGSAFGGWATTADGSRVYGNCERVSDLTTENEGNVNLYAVWEPYYIQVTVYVDGELDASQITNMVARRNAQDIPMTRVAVGVYKASNTPNTPIDNQEYTILIGNEEVTSVSVNEGVGIGRVVYNTVTFYTHCDIDVPSQKVLYGQHAHAPEMAERIGYDLDCWSQDSTQRVPFDFANTPIGAARVLDAFWNAKTYTVVYNNNTGSGSMSNGNAVFGQEFAPAACTFTKVVDEVEWRFIGWNTMANGSGTSFPANGAKTIDASAVANLVEGNIVLYAQWIDSNYAAQVGDTFVGKYTYQSPDPNHNFSNLDTTCTIISVGATKYRMEVQLIDGIYTTTMVVADYDVGGWPIFGEFFQELDLAAILATEGTPGTQTIDGKSANVTQYSFTLFDGLATGSLRTVDETGMICYITMTMTLSEQQASGMDGLIAGTYTETIQIDSFTTAVDATSYSVTYQLDQFSDQTVVTRSSSEYLTANAVGFSKDDKVFVEWRMGGGYDYERYHPGERIMSGRTVYGVWETPNTNICWDVTNLLDDMQILLNGNADAWPQNAALNDYLTFSGTSGWSAAAENNTYNFTYNQHSYKMYVQPQVLGGNGGVFTCATPSIVDGNLRLTFDQNNGDNKFYVTIIIYDAALPEFPGYNPQVGDTLTYSAGGYSYVYAVTKVPGSDGWASTTQYQYSATVMGNSNNQTATMYEYPVPAPTTGMYVVTQGTYDFKGQNVNCYVLSMKQITQASGQRATNTLAEFNIGIADGLPYSTMNDMGYGATTYTLQSKSSLATVTKYTVTFNGNGGTISGHESVVREVYGTNGINPSREGYTFLGWATAPDVAVSYDNHSVITSDCTLYAKWDFGGAHLATNGGNGTPSGSTALDLLNFSDSIKVYPHSFGYVNGNQVGTSFTINGFMTVGETTVSPTFRYVTVLCINPSDINNNTMSQIASHVYVNTSFFNAYVGGYPEYIELFVERNYTLTLDVAYGDKTDITYHANGGTGADIQTVGPRNGAIVLKSSDTYSKENYRFLGWATSSNGDPMQSQGKPNETMPSIVSGNIDNGASVDLYAIWEPYVRINYDPNGGTPEYDIDYGAFVKADGETVYEISDGYFLHRNGYTLIGWMSDPNPVGVVTLKYVAGDKVTFPEEQTGTTMNLYACWVPSSDTFRVYYDYNIESMYMWHYPDQYDPLYLAVDVKMPIAQGSYEFANQPPGVLTGWNTAANGSGTPYGLTGYIQLKQKPQGDYVLYGVWKTTATVHFDANGGNGDMANQEIAFGSAEAQLIDNAFTRDGYTFTGWTIQGEHGYHAYLFSINGHCYLYVDTTLPNVTLLANWERQYTVTFVPNGGTFSDEFNTTQIVAEGQTISVPSISKDDFNFYGWVIEDNEIINFPNYHVDRNLTVYARWVYTVHYYQWDQELNDGDGDWVENLELRNTEAQGEIAIPAIQARDHYTAVWNTYDDGTGDDVTPDTMYELAHEGGETNLYEIYRPMHMTVILDPGEGEGEYENLIFYYGQETMCLNVDDPYREGFIFTGWNCREGTFTSSGEGSDVKDLYYDNRTVRLTAQYQAE